ncbi:MAG TPA: hypothetical protein VKY89_22490 [Thermoanaerobaculia bacterium]|nr:hypothetical protein [Thermoanaerobaculia bacterium]
MLRSRLRPLLLPAGVCLLGLVVQFHPMILAGFGAISGDPGDSRLVNYLLEHTFRWAVRRPDHASFWNLPMFFPAKNVLAYSESLLGVAPLYCLWRGLAVPPDAAFQLWLLSMAALNFAGCHLLLRRTFGCERAAAACGSFLFAFGNSRTAQLHHPQLLSALASLLTLYCLGRLLRQPRAASWWLPAAVACMVAQVYAGYYVAWSFAFGLGLCGCFCMLDRRCRDAILAVRVRWPAALLSLAVASLAIPWLLHGVAVVREAGWYPFAGAAPLLPRPQSWLYMGRRSWLYFGLRNLSLFTAIPAEHEQRLGIGIATTACAALGLWRQRRQPWVKPLAFATAALIVLTTQWPYGLTPWRVVHAVVPGAGGIRAVSRLGLLLLFPAGLGIAGFVRPGKRRWQALLVALCLLEQGYASQTYSKRLFAAAAARVAAAVPAHCRSFYAAVAAGAGQDASAVLHQLDAVSAESLLGVPTINGYSGHQPQGYGELTNNVIAGAADPPRLRAAFDRWRLAGRLDESCFVIVPSSY